MAAVENAWKWNDDIRKFPKFAELQSFEIAFRNEGVIKLEHTTDVTPENLKKLGW